MERKDIKIGTRVRPSGKGFTKDWKPDIRVGEVVRMGKNFIIVRWDDGGYVSTNLKAMHLEPETAPHDRFDPRDLATLGGDPSL